MKILIIEDEHPNFLRLKKLLKELDSSYTVEGPLISQSAVKDYFENGNRPDLIISDIRLSDGLVFDAFDDVNCDTRIIFKQHIPNMLSRLFNITAYTIC